MFTRNNIFAFIVFVVSLFSISPLPAVTDGLIAYYPFSGSAEDESGNGYDGEIFGATLTNDRFGNPDSAYYFDGLNDYVKVPAASEFQLEDSLTLSAWVYHLTNISPQHIVNMSTLYSGYRLAAWWANPAGYSLEVYDQSGQQFLVDDGHQPLLYSWTHVAGTWDGSTLKIYRDGEFLAETDFTNLMATDINDLYIGVLNPVPWPMQGYFHGYIDEVRIYNRALSEEEIPLLMVDTKIVEIDIIPNSVNLNFARVLPVAILSSQTFDALTVIDESILVSGANVRLAGKTGEYMCQERDVNNDGYVDLICNVETADIMIEPGEDYIELTAQTNDGTNIQGTDLINIVPK